jgi:hypothetical protein
MRLALCGTKSFVALFTGAVTGLESKERSTILTACLFETHKVDVLFRRNVELENIYVHWCELKLKFITLFSLSKTNTKKNTRI